MKFIKHLLLSLFLLVTFSNYSQSYESREGDSINPRIYINTGVYFPNVNTRLRVDGSVIGGDISLEDDLKLSEDVSVFRTDAIVRLTDKSTIVGSFTSINRENQLILEEDLVFEDIVFEAGSGIEFNFDINYIAATYRYNFFNELNWNAGLSAGLRAVFIDIGADGRINDAEGNLYKESFVAPAILFGAHGSAYLTPRLLARYSLEAFWLQISGTKISVLESNFSLSWFFTKPVGIGISYATNDYRVEDIPLSDDFKGRVEFNFGGLNLFLTARF